MVVRLIEKADRWQRELASGIAGSRAELARREKTSTGRVSQVLRLLDLPEPLVAAIRQLPPGTPARLVTERMLRRGLSGAAVSKLLKACKDATDGAGPRNRGP
jgi:ParB-like chromosome segregation protein Spo0J